MIASDMPRPPIVSTRATTSPASAMVAELLSVDIKAVQAWKDRELEFAAMRAFGENWDGYGSAPPTVEAMEAGALFLLAYKEHVPKPPARIALSPEGFLTVDWIEGNGLIRAEIRDFDEVEWMSALPGRSAEFFTTPLLTTQDIKAEQGQTWQPASGVDEPAFASAR